jgi:DNA-binding NarL/FixJ family response regulator
MVPPLAIMHLLVGAANGADATSPQAGLGPVNPVEVPMMAAVVHAAEAVRIGRAGDGPAATARMEHALHELKGNSFVQAATIRIAAPCAAAEGWGDPAAWIATALATFEARDLPAPSKACLTLLRELGAPIAASHASTGDGISKREHDVLELVVEGLANKAIAQRLFVSPRTVEKHVERLLAKTESANRSQLVTYALRRSAPS